MIKRLPAGLACGVLLFTILLITINCTKNPPVFTDISNLTRTTRTASLPANRGPWNLYYGDMIGTREPEIIAASSSHMAIYSTKGKIIRITALRHNNYVPSFLYDWDSDGKQDLVMGTMDSAAPEILILDGQGNEKDRVILKKSQYNFSAILPQFVTDEGNGRALYSIAKPGWATNPRGVLKFRLDNMTMEWFFHIPSNPESLCLSKSLTGTITTISHFTEDTGESRFIGLAAEPMRTGSDNQIHLFQLDAWGNTTAAEPLYDPENGGTMQGQARFQSLDAVGGTCFPSGQLLLIQNLPAEFSQEGPLCKLYLVDTKRKRIVSYGKWEAGIVIDVSPLRTSEKVGLVAIIRKNERNWKFIVYDSQLSIRTSVNYQTNRVVLCDTPAGLFASIDNEVFRISSDALLEKAVTLRNSVESFTCFEFHDEGFIASISGMNLEIITLTRFK